MRFLRENALSLFFGVIFLAAVAGESVAGRHVFNEEQRAHGEPTVGYLRYVVSSDFGVALLENWQSEWLQFVLFVVATIWLVQRGAVESKPPGHEGLDTDEEQLVGEHAHEDAPALAKVRGVPLWLYSNSLALAILVLFAGSWLGQSVTGWTEYNDRQQQHGEAAVSWTGYLGRPDFWERTLQNWQSEFLAIGTFTIFSVYLRQRGSPESKPVGMPHDQTPG